MLAHQDVARLLVRCYPQYPDTLAICLALLQRVEQQLLAHILSNSGTSTADVAPALPVPPAPVPSDGVAGFAAQPSAATLPLALALLLQQQQYNSSSSSAGQMLSPLLSLSSASSSGQGVGSASPDGVATDVSLPRGMLSLVGGGGAPLSAGGMGSSTTSTSVAAATVALAASGLAITAGDSWLNLNPMIRAGVVSAAGVVPACNPVIAPAQELTGTATRTAGAAAQAGVPMGVEVSGAEANLWVPLLGEATDPDLALSLPFLAGDERPPLALSLPDLPALSEGPPQFLDVMNWE